MLLLLLSLISSWLWYFTPHYGDLIAWGGVKRRLLVHDHYAVVALFASILLKRPRGGTARGAAW